MTATTTPQTSAQPSTTQPARVNRDAAGGAPVLVLASASPRRIGMLQAAGVAHVVHPADVDEERQGSESPEEYVARVSRAKAEALGGRYGALPVLGADTIVVAGGSLLGKAPHEGAARQMLQLLSGATHEVYTGYHLRLPSPAAPERSASRVVRTEVAVRPLREEEIEGYLRSEEWRGKAGAYAVQGRFGCFIRAVNGSYDSVVGLPLCQVLEDLLEHGVLPPTWPGWRP